MFGQKRGPGQDKQKESFIDTLLTGISLSSIAVLILIGPDFYHHTKDFAWAFLSSRYAPALVPVAFAALYLAAYPAMFFLMRGAWTNPLGLAVFWVADKIF